MGEGETRAFENAVNKQLCTNGFRQFVAKPNQLLHTYHPQEEGTKDGAAQNLIELEAVRWMPVFDGTTAGG